MGTVSFGIPYAEQGIDAETGLTFAKCPECDARVVLWERKDSESFTGIEYQRHWEAEHSAPCIVCGAPGCDGRCADPRGERRSVGCGECASYALLHYPDCSAFGISRLLTDGEMSMVLNVAETGDLAGTLVLIYDMLLGDVGESYDSVETIDPKRYRIGYGQTVEILDALKASASDGVLLTWLNVGPGAIGAEGD